MHLRSLWWVLLPAVGLAELAGQFVVTQRAPRPEAYRELGPLISKLRRNEELVVMAPRWAEPLVRRELGNAMPVEQLARPDETLFASAIEISALGATSPELSQWPVTNEARVGDFTVRVRKNPSPARPLFSFVDAVEQGRAQVLDAGSSERTCPFTARARVSAGSLPSPPTFPARRFQCRGGEFFFVGVTVIDDQDYRPRRCIWAHPPAEGSRVVRFERVPLGRTIYGYTALPWLIMRDGLGTPVQLAVRVGERVVGRVEHRDTEGWSHFEFPTGAEPGALGDVTFEVQSERPDYRHFCFYADTR